MIGILDRNHSSFLYVHQITRRILSENQIDWCVRCECAMCIHEFMACVLNVDSYHPKTVFTCSCRDDNLASCRPANFSEHVDFCYLQQKKVLKSNLKFIKEMGDLLNFHFLVQTFIQKYNTEKKSFSLSILVVFSTTLCKVELIQVPYTLFKKWGLHFKNSKFFVIAFDDDIFQHFNVILSLLCSATTNLQQFESICHFFWRSIKDKLYNFKNK